MKFAPRLCLILSLAALFANCTSEVPKNSNQSNQAAAANSNAANHVKDDVDELELTIKLPFHPEDADWIEDNTAGSRKLTAVLLFLKEDAEKIVAQAQNYRQPQNEKISTEKWFPNELIAQSQTSGDETLKGQSYAANDFYNPPYTDGKVTRIEGTNYFILELFAK